MSLARPKHGADVYDLQGRLRALKDFSSTVPSLPPPSGWRAQTREALDALQRYPRPHSRGLDASLGRSLGLAEGSVLVTNGASEALSCCAWAASGKRVRLLAPCFGEYRTLLERAGAKVTEFWWENAALPSPERLLAGLAKGSQIWLANPGNPLGQTWSGRDLLALASACARRGLSLLVDEALRAQRLDGAPEGRLLAQAQSMPVLWLRSLGKGLGLPGLRLGYVAGPAKRVQGLRRFQEPWSVNGLAQELGSWAFNQERRGGQQRVRALRVRAEDLRARLRKLGLRILSSATVGYTCVDLGAFKALGLARALEQGGFLVRDASSFGPGAQSWLRLNPGSIRDNRALVQSLALVLART